VRRLLRMPAAVPAAALAAHPLSCSRGCRCRTCSGRLHPARAALLCDVPRRTCCWGQRWLARAGGSCGRTSGRPARLPAAPPDC
jgi:hypothetical protein